MNRTFRPREHIRRRAEFQLAYESGFRASGRFMTLFVRQTSEPTARLGIAATRKIGGAVVRNRAKRLARELFRHHKPSAGVDLVVVPRREFLDVPYATLEREFNALLERVSAGTNRRRARATGDSRARRAGSDSYV
ncbi:MAG TPA: ribonuclease P protein component [Vicinamibacterales bacterium]|nr:ribonuclease P protein component [Vicinamibacterales bacterium]